MPPHAEVPTSFTCPRCGYFSDRKSNIRKHFGNKKMCIGHLSDVTLTEEVTDYVLSNKRYINVDYVLYNKRYYTRAQIADMEGRAAPTVVEPPQAQHVNNFINNNNTQMNFIMGMDAIFKHTQLLTHKEKEGQDFYEIVEATYTENSQKLLNDTIRRSTGPVQFDQSNFIEMVHRITRSNEPGLDDMSVFYHQVDNRIHICSGGGEWDEFSCEDGIRKIIETLAECYLESYEIYLIRKIERTTGIEQSSMRNSLEEYYRFIASFKIPTCVVGKNDTQIMYNDEDAGYDSDVDTTDDDQHIIIDRYNTLYHRIANELTNAQKNAINKRTLTEVKTTTKKNLRELNRSIMNIINVDEAFRTQLFLASQQ